MIATVDALSLFAVLIPVAWLVAGITLPLTGVSRGLSLRTLHRPGTAPMADAVSDDRDERLAA